MSKEAKAKISLNAKPFEDGANLAIKSSQKMASVMTTAMGTAIGAIDALGAVGALKKLAGGIKSLTTGGIDLAVSMSDLAAETGMAADEAMKFNFAMENGLRKGAAEALMGSAAKNIGETAETFSNLKIRLEAIWLNIQGVFTKIASFFAPIIDQILEMVEQVDWDAWVKSAEEFITPIKNGIMAVAKLATEGRLWEFAGKVMKLGFKRAGNYLFHVFKVTKKMASALGPVLKASFKGIGNTVIWLGKLIGRVFKAVFDTTGEGFGDSILFGVLAAGSKISGFLLRMLISPLALLVSLAEKAIEEMLENLPDSLKTKKYENFKAKSFSEIAGSHYDIVDREVAKIDKNAAEIGKEFIGSLGDLSGKIKKAVDNTPKIKDTLGAGEDLEKAKEAFIDALDTKYVDKTGASGLSDEIKIILADAFARIKDTESPDTENIKKIKPVFGKADSLASVGGGGGVGRGLTGVLNENRRQTRLQEKMVDLLDPGAGDGGPGLRTGKLNFSF